MRRSFIIISVLILAAITLISIYVWPPMIWSLVIVGPLIALGIHDLIQPRHAILRLYPIFGHGRYIADWLRPKVYQYFIEPDHDGRPFNRIQRSVIYSRSKDTLDTTPFGTQLNVYAEGHEWFNHSIAAIDAHQLDPDPRVMIGGKDCTQPYNASLLNISAMSYGSLSKNAIKALNGGAQLGGFAHNTGEGGISPYHLEPGGDLIWQVGTGYFGCRDEKGNFDSERFRVNATLPNVKMIELKLSQGAKPGHGGILPARKVTPEISQIRHVPMGADVISPPAHKEFSDPCGMLEFIGKMRELSGGKPVGFKLCIGHKAEFLAICKAMIKTGITPDFITVDGAEGGTGAAPVEFSDSVGMPMKDGLAFTYNALDGFGLKEQIKLICSGKIATGAHIFQALALGADACNSARAMMMSVGCIQALVCNTNKCPTGVATQDPQRVKALVVSDKTKRVYNYHRETVMSFVELMGASGISDPDMINRSHVYRRIIMDRHERYDQIYPYIPTGCLLNDDTVPQFWKFDMQLCGPNTFMLHQPLTKMHL